MVHATIPVFESRSEWRALLAQAWLGLRASHLSKATIFAPSSRCRDLDRSSWRKVFSGRLRQAFELVAQKRETYRAVELPACSRIRPGSARLTHRQRPGWSFDQGLGLETQQSPDRHDEFTAGANELPFFAPLIVVGRLSQLSFARLATPR